MTIYVLQNKGANCTFAWTNSKKQMEDYKKSHPDVVVHVRQRDEVPTSLPKLENLTQGN